MIAAFGFYFALKADIRREITHSQEIIQLRLDAIESNQKANEVRLESNQKASQELLTSRLDRSEEMVQLIIQSLIDSRLRNERNSPIGPSSS